MTVGQLIEELKKYPQDIQVARELHSEQFLMGEDDFFIDELCEPRNDGWIQNKRPDMKSQKYLLFRGN